MNKQMSRQFYLFLGTDSLKVKLFNFMLNTMYTSQVFGHQLLDRKA